MDCLHFSFLRIILLLLITSSYKEETLVFVYTHFRHGARGTSSIDKNGTDLFGQKWVTPDDLTGVGLRMHYALGLRNRKKYQNFLKKNFDPREILVLSTDYNRTIQSAYAQLQGLYEPLTEQDITPEEEKRMNEMNGYSADIQKIINKTISNLNYFSLPGKIEVVPIHVYNKIDHKILLSYEYRVNGCKGIIKNRENNKGTLSSLISGIKEKEGKNIEAYFSDKTKKSKY